MEFAYSGLRFSASPLFDSMNVTAAPFFTMHPTNVYVLLFKRNLFYPGYVVFSDQDLF